MATTSLVDAIRAELQTTGAVSATANILTTVPASSTVGFRVRCCINEATGPSGGYFDFSGCAQRGAAGNATLLTVPAAIISNLSAALATAGITIQTSTNTIQVKVTGIALLTINWLVHVDIFLYQP
jgi:hypothetical protein